MITQARSKRHMPMTSVPLTLLPVSTTDDRETARRLIGEYLNWISDIAGQQYRLSFDIDAMLRSDLNDATKFYPPHGRFYLVQSRDGAIGVGALKRLSVEVGEIQRMYVQPSARGLGAGRLLVQRLLDDARALGLRRVRLESLKALAAHALYRSVGFVEIAPYADNSMQDYLSHTALQRYRASAVFMEIELSSQGRGASAPGAGEPQHHRRHGAAGLKHRNPLTQEVIMIKEAIVSPKLAPPAGPFSAAIRSGGFVYLSGQIGQDPASGKLIEGDIEKQTEQIFSNLAAVLEAAGKSFNDVVRAGVYLTNIGDFSAMNAIYAKHFEKPFPARTTIGVAALPLGAAVEIDFVVKD